MAAGLSSSAWITWLAAYIFATCPYALGEEECVRPDIKIQCYDCDSKLEPRCHDPFNNTEENRPNLKECKGCCVKIVTNHGKLDQEVRRTCTERLHINFFLVDHVCMYESGGGGHMCFCETDFCNSAPPTKQRHSASTTAVLAATVVLLLPSVLSQRPPLLRWLCSPS